MKTIKKIRNIAVAVAIPVIAGSLSGFLSSSTMDTYKTLNQPAFAPPGWIFGPAWLILYILMGYASYRVWAKRDGYNIRGPLTLYGTQLMLNFFWSLIFFRWALRGLALIELLVLLLLIIITAIKFHKIDKPAAWLLFPYIAWVSFAGLLNYSVWTLNR